MHVTRIRKKWPERNQRRRKWFSVKAAARAVNEPELVEILKLLAKKPKSVPQIEEFRKAS